MQNTQDTPVVAEQEEAPVDSFTREMMEAGLFYGRTKNKTHPRMKTSVVANRNGVDIIDLKHVVDTLNKCLEFLKRKAEGGATVLLVATQPAAREEALKFAEEFGIPSVTNRWLGGTLTNFEVISKRLEYYRSLKKKIEANAFEEYTKKERLDRTREAEKLGELWGGIENLMARPDVLLVVDPIIHKTAVREAQRAGIPVVAFANTDVDPADFEHFVLGNTSARASISWFFEKASEVFRNAKKVSAAKKPGTKEEQ